MLRFAKEFTAPLTLAGAKGFAPLVYHCRRQGAYVQEQAEEGIALSTQMGFPFWRAIGLFWRGWSLAEQGHYEEGIEQMQQGLTAQRETGSSVNRVHFSVLLAEAYGHARQFAEGLHLLAEAEAEMEKTDERLYEAELWRIYGELSLRRGERAKGGTGELKNERAGDRENGRMGGEDKEVAQSPIRPIAHSSPEECFLHAAAIARQQQAKSLELRAVMSLVRLRQQQALEQGAGSAEQGEESQESGVRSQKQEARAALTEAHSMLVEVYNWFTEGFDTKDLQEAQALIEELGKMGKRGKGRKSLGVSTSGSRES